MSDFGQRLKQAIKNAGKTQAELAEFIGIKQQSVQYLCTGRAKSSKHIIKIANFLNTTPEWLESGSEKEINGVAEEQAVYDVNRISLRPLPVFKLKDIDDGKNPPLFKMPCPIEHSSETYAAIVPDNTMEASMGPSYPEGSIIFIDPTKAKEAKSGDPVIARLLSRKTVTFKILKETDYDRRLDPLNLKWDAVPDRDFEIIGLVIGCWIGSQPTS